MSTSIELARPASANPRGRQPIGPRRRTTAADALQAVALVLAAATAVALAAAATALASSLPSGTYTTTISKATNTQLDGRWTVTFSPGHYVVSAAGRQLDTGTDSASGGLLTLHDTGGPLCQTAPGHKLTRGVVTSHDTAGLAKSTPPNQVGTYTYSSSGSTLTLKVKHDGCSVRATILASHPLTRS